MAADAVKPVKPKRSERVIEDLRTRIATGHLAPGTRLPTEIELVKQFGVSRTVIREAVAVLAADGLLQPRQGAGVFVTERPNGGRAQAPPRDGIFGMLVDLPGRLSAVLNVLEVRLAVESEAAALAAQRRSAAQEAEIREAYERFNQDLGAGRPTGDSDFEFHRAIALATNNPFYAEIFDVLGRRTIPRDLVSMALPSFVTSRPYLETMQVEHSAILDAIAEADPTAARAAMRRHLAESQRRYQFLFQKSANARAGAGVGAEAGAAVEG